MVKHWFRLSGKLKVAETFGGLIDAFQRAVESFFQQNECQSVHVLFDCYNKASIMSGTRLKRSHSTVPIEQEISLRRDFEIAKEALKLDDNHELLTSGGSADLETVGTSISRNIEYLQSNHEEADTCFVLHGIDCSLTVFGRLIVHSRDIDVLSLMIYFHEKLPASLWLKFGTSKKPKFIPVHDIAKKIDPDVRKALFAYHAITACDSTSAFSGHRKNLVG
ncbi:hypothetical protein JTB14_004277 [Gonioctena quinquepunctata]|nr:hypothetical protein JTB14_004277 [Gonioctena quinquepunctata]